MRKYGTIPSDLWLDPQIKQFGINTLLTAIYLRSNSHDNMIHLYRLPTQYAMIDLGLSKNDYLEAMSNLVTINYCKFDPLSDVVWVESAMVFDIGSKMKKSDNRVIGLQKLIPLLPSCQLKRDFQEKYGRDYLLKYKPPYKPPRSKEQEQEQEQGKTNKPSTASLHSIRRSE